jgi:poly(3-hydroxybutyrate) depolymerase
MKKNTFLSLVLLFVLAIVLSAPASAADKVQTLSFDFGGKSRTYYFLAPADNAPLPLVILPHGSGRNGNVMTDAWKGLASKENFIIAAPDAYKSDWLLATDGPNFMHELVEQVKSKHAVDPGRIYLFGHSGGAEYALMLALLESEYFAAAAIHAGAMHKENSNLFDYAKRKIPISIWVGDRDQFYSLEVVKATREMFQANGFDVGVSVIPIHDHNYYIVSGNVNKEAWEFLKKRN